jgi:DNA replication protein DnaC
VRRSPEGRDLREAGALDQIPAAGQGRRRLRVQEYADQRGSRRDLSAGGFITQQRSLVLISGTGTGKTHLAIAIARSCVRAGSRGRFFAAVDLVNQLEAESRVG